MTELSERLELLGLTQYLETFVSEGFDSWETIQDITESDLYVSGDVQSAIFKFLTLRRNSDYLNVKLGHRRVRNKISFDLRSR